MNKVIAAILGLWFVMGVVGNASAVDFGGTVDNQTGLYWDTLSSSALLEQTDTVTAWFSAPLSTASRLYAQGSYQFTLDRYYLFDVDLLNIDTTLTGVSKGLAKLDMIFGRYVGSDITGYVFNHRMDGLQLDYANPGADFTVTVGYTGLLLKPNSTIVMSNLDTVDQRTSSVTLGSPRLIMSAKITYPQLFAFQTLALDMIIQEDLHTGDSLISPGETVKDPNRGGKLDTQYYGFSLSGPLSPNFFYSAFSYLNTGTTLSYVVDSSSGTGFSYQPKPIVAYAGGITLDLYPQFLKSHFGLEGFFSTGDPDAESYNEGNTKGLSTTFVPISQNTSYAVVYTPQLGNLARFGIDFSLKPFSGSASTWASTFQAELKALAYIRPVETQPVSAGGVRPGVGGPYLGSEIDAYLRVRPYSDFGLELASGVFLPNKGTNQPFGPDEPIGFRTRLKGVINF